MRLVLLLFIEISSLMAYVYCEKKIEAIEKPRFRLRTFSVFRQENSDIIRKLLEEKRLKEISRKLEEECRKKEEKIEEERRKKEEKIEEERRKIIKQHLEWRAGHTSVLKDFYSRYF